MPMEEKFIYTDKERELSEQIFESLKKPLGETFYENDLPKLREHLDKIISLYPFKTILHNLSDTKMPLR